MGCGVWGVAKQSARLCPEGARRRALGVACGSLPNHPVSTLVGCGDLPPNPLSRGSRLDSVALRGNVKVKRGCGYSMPHRGRARVARGTRRESQFCTLLALLPQGGALQILDSASGSRAIARAWTAPREPILYAPGIAAAGGGPADTRFRIGVPRERSGVGRAATAERVGMPPWRCPSAPKWYPGARNGGPEASGTP